jgi:uncharacterized membrane protein YbhN (UPF0104 family)
MLAVVRDMFRENRRRGISANWTKSGVTALASIIISLTAMGLLYVCMKAGYFGTGIALFAAVTIAGLIAIAFAVNRRWPVGGSRAAMTTSPGNNSVKK